MEAKSDAQLLREYAEQGSEAAFAEIVSRHSSLVYSAALRQAGWPDLARDITQSVFTDLARKARSLAGNLKLDASLVGWLYRSTRYATLTLLRNEHRRRERERQVMEQVNPSAQTPLDWDYIRPVLDEAMTSLNAAEREALLLRFFKNHDFRAVGAALGISDDAAQKRVARSIEKLRAILLRRGVTTTAAALSSAISVNAVQATPAGFAAALTSTSLAAVASGSARPLVELMAMTKTQLGIVSAIVIASVVTPIMLHIQARGKLDLQQNMLRQRSDEVARAQAGNARLSNLIAQSRAAPVTFNQQLGQLVKLRGEVARLRQNVRELSRPKSQTPKSRSEMLTSMARKYSDRIAQVRQAFEQNPTEQIPELQYMRDQDWLRVIYHANLDTEEGYRRAMSSARLAGQNNFVMDELHDALDEFWRANNGAFPTDLSELRPHFKKPVDDAVLQRWQIVPMNRLYSGPRVGGDWAITPKAPINVELDQRMIVGLKTVTLGASGTQAWTLLP